MRPRVRNMRPEVGNMMSGVRNTGTVVRNTRAMSQEQKVRRQVRNQDPEDNTRSDVKLVVVRQEAGEHEVRRHEYEAMCQEHVDRCQET